MVLLSCRAIDRFPSLVSLFLNQSREFARKPSAIGAITRHRRIRRASNLATLQNQVDVALSLAHLDAISRDDLAHEIVPALESRQILRGELAPLGSDFTADHLAGVGG